MKGVGHAPREHPGVPRSMSLNALYLKEQEYIRFMAGERFPRYYALYKK